MKEFWVWAKESDGITNAIIYDGIGDEIEANRIVDGLNGVFHDPDNKPFSWTETDDGRMAREAEERSRPVLLAGRSW